MEEIEIEIEIKHLPALSGRVNLLNNCTQILSKAGIDGQHCIVQNREGIKTIIMTTSAQVAEVLRRELPKKRYVLLSE